MRVPRLSSAVATLCAGTLLLGPTPGLWASEGDTARPTSVHGRAVLVDGKTAAKGATVMAINLESREVFTSATTDSNGDYRISGLPVGYYDFAIESDGKLYVADGILTLQGDTRASFELNTAIPEQREWWQSGATKKVAILNRTPDGTARLVSDHKESFWRGRNGIAVLIAGGAAAVALALGGSSGGNGAASPSTP
jgi:hypothetical protein